MRLYLVLLLIIGMTMQADNKQIFDAFLQEGTKSPETAIELARKNPWVVHYCAQLGMLDVLTMVYDWDKGLFYSSSTTEEFFELEKEYDVDIVEGDTLLHGAAYCCQMDVIKYLLEKNLSPFVPNNEAHNPLYRACILGNYDAFAAMQEHLVNNPKQLQKLEENIKEFIAKSEKKFELEIGLIKILRRAYQENNGAVIDLFKRVAKKEFVVRCAFYAALDSEHINDLRDLVVSKEIDLSNEQQNQFLHVAVASDKYKSAQFLLESSIPIDCINGERESALSLAVLLNKRDMVALLLPWYAKTSQGVELLIDAIHKVLLEPIETLLITAYEFSEHRQFPVSMSHVLLYGAINSNNLDRIKEALLIFNHENNSNINFGVVGEKTVLIKALEVGNLDVIQLLLENGADISLPEQRNKQKLLDCALEYPQFSINILKAHSNAYNLMYDDFIHLIVAALKAKKRELFEPFKEERINLSRHCLMQGISPCIAALRYDPEQLTSVLALTERAFALTELFKEFERACKENDVDVAIGIAELPLFKNKGALLFIKTFMCDDNIETNTVLKGLLRRSKLLNSVNKQGESVLAQLIKDKHEQLTSILLQYGANPNLGTLLPLGIAIEQRDVNLVKKLLEYGANPNSCYKNQLIIMLVALDVRDSEQQQMLALLLKAGANCNIRLPNSEEPTSPFEEMSLECRADALAIRLLSTTLKILVITGNYDSAYRILVAKEPTKEEIFQVWNAVNAMYYPDCFDTGCAMLNRKNYLAHNTHSNPSLLGLRSRLCDIELDANTRCSNGNTLLHWAVRNNNTLALQFLIKHRASLKIRNHKLISAGRLIQRLQKDDILELKH